MSRREKIWLTFLAIFAAGLLAASWWANEQADRTDLVNAVRNATFEHAVTVIERGVNPNIRSPEGGGCSVLYYAVKRRDARLVRLLLEHGADPTVACFNPDRPKDYDRGQTPLHAAAVTLPEVIPDLLAHGAAADAKDAWGDTPLHVAACNTIDHSAYRAAIEANEAIGNHFKYHLPPELFMPLLDAGVDPNAEGEKGLTPLQLAIERGNVPLARTLLSRGAAFPKILAEPWHEPIALAASSYNLDMIELVLELGYSVREAHGRALVSHDVDVVRFLLDAGMDANAIVDENGLTALHAAPSAESALLLLEHGADVNAIDNYGRTPLNSLISLDWPEVWAALLKRGADVNVVANFSGTPLHSAVKSDTNAAAQFLLEHGANVNARDASGHTPLHEAARRIDPKKVRLLLKNGADPRATNDSGATPADMIRYEMRGRAEAIAIMDLLSEQPLFAAEAAAPRVDDEHDDDDDDEVNAP